MKKNVLVIILILAGLVSCKKDKNDGPGTVWKDSVFIVNEGPFQNGTGSVMAFNRNTGELSGDLFEAANGKPLGNVVQSLAVNGDKAWICVNNSNKIEVVNVEDFTSVRTIKDITLPRYVVFHGDKAYVSCWDNTVKVISTQDYSVVDEVTVGTGPEEMVIEGDFLFVINGGGFDIDSTVSFFNLNDEEIFGRITVGHRPSGIARDKGGKLWVLCSGKGWNGFPQQGDTQGQLNCIDPASRTVINTISFPESSLHPEQLVANKDGSILYYAYPDGIYAFPVMDPALSSSPLIASEIMFYSLGYDPVSGMLYASDPLDFAQNGRVYRYNVSGGAAVDSFEAGVVPTGFWFNQ